MASEVFYWLLNMSLQGGLVCILVLLLRQVLPRIRYVLWLAPLIRLTVPFGIPSKLSLMALLRRFHGVAVPISPLLHATNSMGFAESYDPFRLSDRMEQVFSAASSVWLVGAALCLLTALTLAILSHCVLRSASPLSPGVLESDRVSAPLLRGIFRPVVILPPQTPAEILPHVLLHEGIHRRRLDNLWRTLALILCCLHWFNPVVWFSLRFFFEDMELSCDAAAIRSMSKGERKTYARALLTFAEDRSLFAASFGGARLRVRIEQILTYRRLTYASSLFFVSLATAIILLLTLN